MSSEKFNSEQRKLIQQSHNAYQYDEFYFKKRQREAAAVNGDIVTDSDTDPRDDDNEENAIPSPTQINLSQSIAASDQSVEADRNEEAVKILMKKKASIWRKARYARSKLLAKQKFLSRKQTQKVSKILSDCPDIGKEIERFVEERNIGADAWRHTGVLTFDGNRNVKHKVTYKRIKEHLETVYQRKISFGSVVQLCVARNRRRKSANRYKGVARVTCRRARKGFQLKYNPDSHWSNALYKGLNKVQYTDGRQILNINRDDAAGFRLDTMATHRLHKTPVVQGHESLTTYTDYVNRYPSILQTTSYNFTGTQTTGEVCVGIVKGSGVYPKNPGQHAADLAFLEQQDRLRPVFANKVIECIRVDGAADEGPSHEEVQFFWTAHHIATPTAVTLVSARNGGASYLNRVELQNGCLSLAHANVFIPSTLGGSCLSS